MHNYEASQCDGLIDYIAGLGSNIERKRFERHLASCPVCKEEAVEFGEVWERLPEDMELLELPADLKDEVFRPLFVQSNNPTEAVPDSHRSNLKRAVLALAWTAALAAVFMAGWLARATGIPSSEATMFTETAPTRIDKLFHLTAALDNGKFTDNPRAYGVACIVRSEHQDQFVVYIFGSPETRGSETYQVWIWNDGERHSAGKFTVDSSGIGIMTIPVTEQTPVIESVSVSLEPDHASTRPEGTKMFQSEENYSAGFEADMATIVSHLLG